MIFESKTEPSTNQGQDHDGAPTLSVGGGGEPRLI